MFARRLLWWLMTAMCLVFAPMAAEFYWVNEHGGVATYAQVLSWTVSESFAFGAGSGFAIMTPHWRHMPDMLQIVLGVHAVLASIALCIGPFLFVEQLRTTRPKVHRRLGQTYVCLVVVAMVLSMIYLAYTPFDRIYGGAPFAVGLWGIAVLTLYTAVVGTWHILRRELEAHRSVMILNFAAMLIAPMLRLWWGVLGVVFDGVTQADTHVVALMILGVETFVGAIVVVHATRRPGATGRAIRQLQARAAERIVPLSTAAIGLGALAALLGVHQRLLRFAATSWSPARDAAFLLTEQGVFATHAPWFALEATALAALLVALPLRFRALYSGGPIAPRKMLGIAGLALAVSAAWTAQGLALWATGTAAWGSASFRLVLATALLSVTGPLMYGVLTRRSDLVRAFALHVFAVALSPAALLLFQLGFLGAGFAPEDAFLSAAVLAPTLTLSGSYYYTAYGSRARTGRWTTDADHAATPTPAGLPA